MLGIWHAVAHGRRRAGAVIAVPGAAIAVVATAVIVPHYAPGGGSPFAGRYAAVGGSPAGIVKTAVTHPLRLVEAASEHRDLTYLLDLLAPLAGLPLLSPLLAASAVPELALNLLSGTRTQTSIHFHYTAAPSRAWSPAPCSERRACGADGHDRSPPLVRCLVVLAALRRACCSGRSPSGGTFPSARSSPRETTS